MRRAFTLIELLVVIGILGTMVTVGIVGIRAGKAHSQLAGATRDILALMRQARSIALITQRQSVITYSNDKVDDENIARVEVTGEKLFDGTADANRVVRTLAGEIVGGAAKDGGAATDAESAVGDGGETLNDVLNPHLSLEVTKGLVLKVEKGEDVSVSSSSDGKVYKSAISVFSTTEYVTSQYASKESAKTAEKSAAAETATTDDGVIMESEQVVWQTNGRTEPHTVWIYPEGSTPDKGLSITVDKFGDCKVSQWAEEE